MLTKTYLIALSFSLAFTEARPKITNGNRLGRWIDRRDGEIDRRDSQVERGSGSSSLGTGAAAAGILSELWGRLNGRGDNRHSDLDDDEDYVYPWNSDTDSAQYSPIPSPAWSLPHAPAPVPPLEARPQPSPTPLAPPPTGTQEDAGSVPYSNGASWAPALYGGGWVAASAVEAVNGRPSASANAPIPSVEAAQPQPQLQTSSLAPSPPYVGSATGLQLQQAAPPVKSLDVTTTAEVVICRKFPDVLSAETVPLTVYPVQTKVNVNCWTTASMPGLAGKVQGDSIWLKTAGGCYINQQNVVDVVDFTVRLEYCVSPRHWVAMTEVKTAPQDCYQCPSLKCPSQSIGTGEFVDVQCYVDGEDARGNNTWVQPVDQKCFLPGVSLNKNGWQGTYGGKC